MGEQIKPPLEAPQAISGVETESQDIVKFFNEIKIWVRDALFASVLALLIVFFVVQPVRVEGVSMQPRLIDQERIFVNRFIYHVKEIHRGDIVVFWYPKDTSKSFIKRVIGVPGDVIEIKSGAVYINGRRLDEVYLRPDYIDHRSYPPVKVTLDNYYVLGDHRDSSNDSRNWGFVPRDNIYGKAIFRYWPVTRLGTID